MSQGTRTVRSAEETGEQEASKESEGYAGLCAGRDLAFDPMKDLNLPASYDEAVVRFRRLQGDRAMEVLN